MEEKIVYLLHGLEIPLPKCEICTGSKSFILGHHPVICICLKCQNNLFDK